jgi:hypothetical protein
MGFHRIRRYWFLLPLGFSILASHVALAGSPRYMVQGAVVYDRQTDLTWQRCTYGQHWREGAGCEGTPTRVTFDDARALAKEGWRLPNLDELRSIVQLGATPTIDPVAFPDTPPLYFWATDTRDPTFSWYVFFENGIANHYYPPRTNKDLVRFVRSGPMPVQGR